MRGGNFDLLNMVAHSFLCPATALQDPPVWQQLCDGCDTSPVLAPKRLQQHKLDKDKLQVQNEGLKLRVQDLQQQVEQLQQRSAELEQRLREAGLME